MHTQNVNERRAAACAKNALIKTYVRKRFTPTYWPMEAWEHINDYGNYRFIENWNATREIEKQFPGCAITVSTVMVIKDEVLASELNSKVQIHNINSQLRLIKNTQISLKNTQVTTKAKIFKKQLYDRLSRLYLDKNRHIQNYTV